MWVVLPLAVFFLLLLVAGARLTPWRAAFLAAAVAWGVVLTLITETLSVIGGLTKAGLVAGWSSAALVLAPLVYRSRRRVAAGAPLELWRSSTAPLRFELVAIAAIVGLVGVIAVVAPPNNMDSMVYHMVRVVHWVQSHGVALFPTASMSNLYNPPWAEYAIAHFQILSGGDRFANGVQWFSLLGGVIGVSLLAKALGASPRAQVLASLVAATIPMGILQGSSTQNDFVVTFWLVCFVAVGLLWLAGPGGPDAVRDRWAAAGMGASLGLALLTKGTAYIYAAPFLLGLGIALVRHRRRRAVGFGATVAVIAVLLNAGYFVRNIALFGSPLAVRHRQEQDTNRGYSAAAAASNVARNLSLHMGTPSSAVNARLYTALGRFHELIHRDLNDPRTTAVGRFRIHYPNTFEDSAGNPLHLLLIAVTVLGVAGSRTLRSNRLLGGYVAALLLAGLLFSAMLKWQPWHSRLQLPLFVLFAPAVGLVLGDFAPRRWIAPLTAAVLVVSAMPWLLFNRTRSLLPQGLVSADAEVRHESIWSASRLEQYFRRGARDLERPYVGAADYLKGHGLRDVGLWLPFDFWEYQLWVLLEDDSGSTRIESVMVDNVSSRLESATFIPDAVIRVRGFQQETAVEEARIRTALYRRRWSSGPVDILVNEDCP